MEQIFLKFKKHGKSTQSSIPWFQPWDETDVAPGVGPLSLRGGPESGRGKLWVPRRVIWIDIRGFYMGLMVI